jgi:hypothetical protein
VGGAGFARLGASANSSADASISDGTFCVFGTDPAAGNASTSVPATVLSPAELLCAAPPFAGTFTYGFARVPVHALINGDLAARSAADTGAQRFTYYDRTEARIESVDTWGGALEGGTWLRLTGRLFAHFRRESGARSSRIEGARGCRHARRRVELASRLARRCLQARCPPPPSCTARPPGSRRS